MNQVDPEDCYLKLQQKTAEFDEFAYIVSHDLKAPVRAITNITGWIEEDLGSNVSEEVKENMQLLRDRADRLEKMINALLQFSRVGRHPSEVKSVNIIDFLNKIISEVAVPPLGQVHLQNSLSEENISINPQLLQIVLQEIISNAFRFNKKPDPEVKIKITEEALFYVFVIKDTGPGIPPESSSKLFTMFYTVQGKDTNYTTGAGLTIARKAAQLAGANIQLTTTSNEGSEFQILWPKI